ncbi:MAG: glycosyltransferase [Sulfuritalea sp.]|nr:glycosyltransferase [Sulfuritalea sp.]
MFLSFLPPFGMRQAVAPYLWVLYKQITHIPPDEIAFIGTQAYFQDPATFDLEQRWDISHRSQEYAGFAIPSAEQLSRYRRWLTPDGLVENLFQSGLLRQETMRQMIYTRLPALENHLRPIIGELVNKENLEAIFSWCNVRSLSAVAAEFNVPVVHSEFGALRGPCYRGTAYLDFRGVNGGTETSDRFARFKSANDRDSLPLLSKAELLDLMLVDPAPLTLTAPDTEIGLALQIEDDSNIVAFANGWDSLRLMKEAGTEFGAGNVRIRHHPGGLQRYPESFGKIDHSASSIEFITRCKTVATINSSVGLEALLFDRDTRILGDSPCSIAVTDVGQTLARRDENSIPDNNWQLEELSALNFLVLGYLIPYEFLFEPDYLRWRLEGQDEADIYRFHLDYWRCRRQWDLEGPREYLPKHEANPLIQRGLLNHLLFQERNQRQRAVSAEKQIQTLEKQIQTLERHLADIHNSLSWRLTSPLRAIDRIAQKSSGFASLTGSAQRGASKAAPLKIAIISKADHCGGGASRVASELASLLNDAGHQADHWLSWAGSPKSENKRSLYGHLRLPIRIANFGLRKIGLPELIPFELGALLFRGRAWEYDLLHFHDLSSAISPLTLLWLSRRKPVVWTIHDCSPFTGGCLYPMECSRFTNRCEKCPQLGTWPIDSLFDFTGFQQGIKRRLAKSGRIHYLTPSTWMARTANSSGMFASAPEVVSNGVNTRTFQAVDKGTARGDLGLPADRTIVLLSAGSLLDERKGIHFAIDALREVRDLQPFILLVGYSSPQLRELLTDFDTHETGYLEDPSELARYYAAADLFLFTSLADNQPLSVLETMATGTPIIGFETGGIPDMVVQGETGFLVPQKDTRALAASLRQVLLNPATLRKWREKGVERAEIHYSHRRFLESHMAVYQRLIEQSDQVE